MNGKKFVIVMFLVLALICALSLVAAQIINSLG